MIMHWIDYNLLQNNSNYNKVSWTMHFSENKAGIKLPIRCYNKSRKAPHYKLKDCSITLRIKKTVWKNPGYLKIWMLTNITPAQARGCQKNPAVTVYICYFGRTFSSWWSFWHVTSHLFKWDLSSQWLTHTKSKILPHSNLSRSLFLNCNFIY